MNNEVMSSPTHGGPDALGVPAHDLSTNANACGPYAPAVQALRVADARHYPDPAYTALTVQLAAWHGVAPARIVLAASGSEFIQRISVAVALQAPGARVWLPAHAYGDYARAAQAAGLVRVDHPTDAALLWACDPSSPLGQPHAGLADQVAALRRGQALVLDQAYEPLRLAGALALGAHGVALLQAWATVDAHDWLQDCRATLRGWKARQIDLLQAAGWRVAPSAANFLVAAGADGAGVEGRFGLNPLLTALRAQGIKLRDCASFGLPGRVRMAVVAPAVQDALMAALDDVTRKDMA